MTRYFDEEWPKEEEILKIGLAQSKLHKRERMIKVGSVQWLQQMEENFGGYHNTVPRNKVSPLAPKTKLNPAGMSGGDRMTRHGYATYYSKHLMDRTNIKTIVECGILKGTGLAIWSQLFPNADIIGLDIDVSHTQNNLQFLKDKGAFQHKAPELYEYDQFADNQEKINEILKGRTIDIAIDDGHHSDSSITNTLDTLMPHLSKQFVYFIEDNRTVQPLLTGYKCKLFNYKKLTVLENE